MDRGSLPSRFTIPSQFPVPSRREHHSKDSFRPSVYETCSDDDSVQDGTGDDLLFSSNTPTNNFEWVRDGSAIRHDFGPVVSMHPSTRSVDISKPPRVLGAKSASSRRDCIKNECRRSAEITVKCLNDYIDASNQMNI